jgi:hypothetical protein
MKYLHYKFHLNAGDTVEVTLDKQANVQLMDDLNFGNYKRGQKFRYYGGLAKTSPIRLSAPSTGHWNVVIDLGGYSGSVNASARVIYS